MSVAVEKLEKSMAKLTIEVSAEDFDKAINKVYLKQRGQGAQEADRADVRHRRIP